MQSVYIVRYRQIGEGLKCEILIDCEPILPCVVLSDNGQNIICE